MTSYIYKLWSGENSSGTSPKNTPCQPKAASDMSKTHQQKNASLTYPLYADVQKLRAKVDEVLEIEDSVLQLEHKIERILVKFRCMEERIKSLERMAGV